MFSHVEFPTSAYYLFFVCLESFSQDEDTELRFRNVVSEKEINLRLYNIKEITQIQDYNYSFT